MFETGVALTDPTTLGSGARRLSRALRERGREGDPALVRCDPTAKVGPVLYVCLGTAIGPGT